MDPRKRLVADGYDAIVERFARWAEQVEGDPREPYLDRLDELVAAGAAVLDLGCGCGLPTAARLAGRYRVTGVDISPGQIAAALYSIIHVPREEHAALLGRIAGWLRPGGVLVAALGCRLTDGQETWLGGRPMYFSSHPAEVSLSLLRAAGFELLEAEQVTIREPEGDAAFLWVVARRTGAVGSLSVCWHVSSAANRASIARHGLDWERMGATGGIASPGPVPAGAARPEEAGVFLCRTWFDAEFFLRFGAHPLVDVWEVDARGLDVPDPNDGWPLYRRPIPAARLRLVRRDVPPTA